MVIWAFGIVIGFLAFVSVVAAACILIGSLACAHSRKVRRDRFVSRYGIEALSMIEEQRLKAASKLGKQGFIERLMR